MRWHFFLFALHRLWFLCARELCCAAFLGGFHTVLQNSVDSRFRICMQYYILYYIIHLQFSLRLIEPFSRWYEWVQLVWYVMYVNSHLVFVSLPLYWNFGCKQLHLQPPELYEYMAESIEELLLYIFYRSVYNWIWVCFVCGNNTLNVCII